MINSEKIILRHKIRNARQIQKFFREENNMELLTKTKKELRQPPIAQASTLPLGLERVNKRTEKNGFEGRNGHLTLKWFNTLCCHIFLDDPDFKCKSDSH
jgi:hypothetical protein